MGQFYNIILMYMLKYTNVLNYVQCLVNHVLLVASLWSVVCQASLSVGILQARILEWVSSRVSSQPRDETLVFHIAGGFFTI